jgi:hypothetical protein
MAKPVLSDQCSLASIMTIMPVSQVQTICSIVNGKKFLSHECFLARKTTYMLHARTNTLAYFAQLSMAKPVLSDRCFLAWKTICILHERNMLHARTNTLAYFTQLAKEFISHKHFLTWKTMRILQNKHSSLFFSIVSDETSFKRSTFVSVFL